MYPLNKFPVGSKVICTSAHPDIYKVGKIYDVVMGKYNHCVEVNGANFNGASGTWKLFVSEKTLDDYM